VKSAGRNEQLEMRLKMAERAVAQLTARLGELTTTLADVVAIRPSLQHLEKVVIGADTVGPFALGFHERETDMEGRPYRWTGNGPTFEFRFGLNRNVDWSFTMELGPNSRSDISTLRGFVDYAEIEIDVSQKLGLVHGVIPARAFARLAIVSFYLPGLFVPSQADPQTPDSRSLGVVFYEFRADPKGLLPGAQAKPVLSHGNESSPGRWAGGIYQDGSSEGNPVQLESGSSPASVAGPKRPEGAKAAESVRRNRFLIDRLSRI
jgi:hypothetical protein